MKYIESKRAPPGPSISLKVSGGPHLLPGHHTQFEYAVANNVIYYDINFVDCAYRINNVEVSPNERNS